MIGTSIGMIKPANILVVGTGCRALRHCHGKRLGVWSRRWTHPAGRSEKKRKV